MGPLRGLVALFFSPLRVASPAAQARHSNSLLNTPPAGRPVASWGSPSVRPLRGIGAHIRGAASRPRRAFFAPLRVASPAAQARHFVEFAPPAVVCCIVGFSLVGPLRGRGAHVLGAASRPKRAARAFFLFVSLRLLTQAPHNRSYKCTYGQTRRQTNAIFV